MAKMEAGGVLEASFIELFAAFLLPGYVTRLCWHLFIQCYNSGYGKSSRALDNRHIYHRWYALSLFAVRLQTLAFEILCRRQIFVKLLRPHHRQA